MMLMKFLVVGLANTTVGLAAIYFAMYFLRFGDVSANAFGYTVGILLGFGLNKRWTFADRDRILPTLIRYLLLIGLAYVVNLFVVLSAVESLELNRYVAQACGIVPYTAIVYLGCRFYVFGRNGSDPTCSPAGRADSAGGQHVMAPARPVDLSIVVPCYNEEAVLPETIRCLSELLAGLNKKGYASCNSRLYFVDDGSRDGTWGLIESSAEANPCIKGIKLSRNRGHQNALLAGLFTAEGEAIISVDADLQDDLGAIEQMLGAYGAGHDIVYGVRKSRNTDTFFKRFTARTYYGLLRSMRVDVIFDHADYRLLSRRAVAALREFGEVNLFLRGIIPQLGFPNAVVYYDRAERFAGESKYPLHKMLSFAWQGITSFSASPLRWITGLGVLVSLASMATAVWVLWVRLFTNESIPGWASTVLPIYFLGGVQLLSLGIIGEYLAKIYLETKRRPRYFIDKTL